jgi:hypothetical protein
MMLQMTPSCYQGLTITSILNRDNCFSALHVKTGYVQVALYSRNKEKTMKDLRFSWRWLWRMLSSGMWCHVAVCSVLRLLVTDNIPSSPILVTLMMEVIRSFEILALKRATQRQSQKMTSFKEKTILYWRRVVAGLIYEGWQVCV